MKTSLRKTASDAVAPGSKSAPAKSAPDVSAPDAPRLRDLEIKLAFLERHVEEQDRVMLDNFRALDRLRREVERLSESLKSSLSRDPASAFPENEKPPHY